jgi:hypothetical protein
MQVKQIDRDPGGPLHTLLVTLLMHTPQAHARATVRTTGNAAVDKTGCTISVKQTGPKASRALALQLSSEARRPTRSAL